MHHQERPLAGSGETQPRKRSGRPAQLADARDEEEDEDEEEEEEEEEERAGRGCPSARMGQAMDRWRTGDGVEHSP